MPDIFPPTEFANYFYFFWFIQVPVEINANPKEPAQAGIPIVTPSLLLTKSRTNTVCQAAATVDPMARVNIKVELTERRPVSFPINTTAPTPAEAYDSR